MRVLCAGPSIAGTKACVVEKESPGCSRGRRIHLKPQTKNSPQKAFSQGPQETGLNPTELKRKWHKVNKKMQELLRYKPSLADGGILLQYTGNPVDLEFFELKRERDALTTELSRRGISIPETLTERAPSSHSFAPASRKRKGQAVKSQRASRERGPDIQTSRERVEARTGTGRNTKLAEEAPIFPSKKRAQALDNTLMTDVKSGKRKTLQGATIGEKLADPSTYPTMTVGEVRQAMSGMSRSTIYRWADEGKLQRAHLGKKQGKRSRMLLLTASVKEMLEKSPE